MRQDAVIGLLMERQHFMKKADEEEYEKLFRLMQPVQPVYWCCPGDPPQLVHRACFNDYESNHGLRSERTLIKGRFQGGTIAYIYADELELYAGAFRKHIGPLSFIEQQVYEVLQREGPMTIQVMKQMTGLLVKHITPALHRLQEAFLVFEDQVDNEWDRGWYVFENEFPHVRPGRFSRVEALKELIMRFLYLEVFTDLEMMKSFFRLPARDIKETVNQLEKEGRILQTEVDGSNGWIRTQDKDILEAANGSKSVPSVFVLHRNDFHVKAHEYRLKEKFDHPEHDILQYILIDGSFQGAVLGKFRNGPFDIEDIVLILPEVEKTRRKDEILRAVHGVNNSEKSPVRKYCGNQEENVV